MKSFLSYFQFCLISFIMIFCSQFVLNAATNNLLKPTSWALMTKEVYVGDTVELRCSIPTQLLLLDEESEIEVIENIHLETNNDCTILKVELKRVSDGYEFSIFFIPWKPGEVKIPNIDLAIFNSVANNFQDKGILVELPEIQIETLSSKLHESELRPIAPPIALPGSIYVLYAIILGIIIFIILLIICCVKIRKILSFLTRMIQEIKFSKNYKKIQRLVKKLEKKDCSDSEFASLVEMYIRQYLEKRFAYPFYAVTASEITNAFNKIFVGLLDDIQWNYVEQISTIIRRCDYIRYAPNGKFNETEKSDLIFQLLKILEFFEKKD